MLSKYVDRLDKTRGSQQYVDYEQRMNRLKRQAMMQNGQSGTYGDNLSFDGEDLGGCYFTKYIINGADPNTFKYIGYGFAMDKKNIYRYGRKISLQEFEDIIKQKHYNFDR